jgi:hypothetical protein
MLWLSRTGVPWRDLPERGGPWWQRILAEGRAEAGRFDLVTTFDAVHDQADPEAVERRVRRSRREGGVCLAQDIKGPCDVHNNRDHSIGTLLYTISCLRCMTVPLARDGRGLGCHVGP